MKQVFKYPDSLENCHICPRNCNVNRIHGQTGFCNTDEAFSISSIFNHKGEEPVIGGEKGICNIFFTGCNLKCIYCQNYQISRPDSFKKPMKLGEIVEKIRFYLDSGMDAIGFVSTSHVVPQILAIINEIHRQNLHPIIVYNTNAYEKQETVKSLEGLVDVYLPDLKYISPDIAKEYSEAEDYPYYATLAIKEMYRQKGSTLHTNEFGQAECGILIRHLVLPNHSDESIKVLRYIASEISTGIHISLMSQYYPCDKALIHPKLNRELQKKEYDLVVNEFLRLGFRNGYIQEMDSNTHYRPDFDESEPFGK